MLAGLLLRVGAAALIALAVGGAAVFRELPLVVYLVLEAALSVVEGWYAPPAAGLGVHSKAAMPPAQLPFVMSGKRYLLVRFVYHAVLVAAFAGGWLVHDSFDLTVVGSSIAATGITLRAWAMATLGERFRGFEARRETGGLETTGPYEQIRHPGYLGLALTDLGAPLVLGVPLLAIGWAVPIALIVRRIALEEPLLAANYPDTWPEYAAKTARLLPGIY